MASSRRIGLLALALLLACLALPVCGLRASLEHQDLHGAAAATEVEKPHHRSHIEVMLSTPSSTHHKTAATATSTPDTPTHDASPRKLAPTAGGSLTHTRRQARPAHAAASLSQPDHAAGDSRQQAEHHHLQKDQGPLSADVTSAVAEAESQQPSHSASASASQHHEQELEDTATVAGAGSGPTAAAAAEHATEAGTSGEEDALIARVLADDNLRAALLAKLTATAAESTVTAAATADEPLPAPAASTAAQVSCSDTIEDTNAAADESIPALAMSSKAAEQQQQHEAVAESPAAQQQHGGNHMPSATVLATQEMKKGHHVEVDEEIYERRHAAELEPYQPQGDQQGEEKRPTGLVRGQAELASNSNVASEEDAEEALDALPAPAPAKGIAIQENPRDRPPVHKTAATNSRTSSLGSTSRSSAPQVHADADSPASASTDAFLSGAGPDSTSRPQASERSPSASSAVPRGAHARPGDRQRDTARSVPSRTISPGHAAAHSRAAAAAAEASLQKRRRHTAEHVDSPAWHSTGHLSVAAGTPSPARALSSQDTAGQPLSPQQRLSNYGPRADRPAVHVAPHARAQDAQRSDAAPYDDNSAGGSVSKGSRTAAAAVFSALSSVVLWAAVLCCVVFAAFVAFAFAEDVRSVGSLGRGSHLTLPARLWFVTARLLRRCRRAYSVALRKAGYSAGANSSALPYLDSPRTDQHQLITFAWALWNGIVDGYHSSLETATEAARRLSVGTTCSDSSDSDALPYVPSGVQFHQQQDYVRKRFTADSAGIGATSEGQQFSYYQAQQPQHQLHSAAGSGNYSAAAYQQQQMGPSSPTASAGYRNVARSGSAGHDAAVWVSLGAQGGRY